DARSEAKAQTGWSERRDVKLCRTDYPGASALRLSRHPSSARRGIVLACGIVSGILLVLSLPKPDLYPLAWIALTPWLYVMGGVPTLRPSLAAAYAAGLVIDVVGVWASFLDRHSADGSVDWNLWIVVCRNSGQQLQCLRRDEPEQNGAWDCGCCNSNSEVSSGPGGNAAGRSGPGSIGSNQHFARSAVDAARFRPVVGRAWKVIDRRGQSAEARCMARDACSFLS